MTRYTRFSALMTLAFLLLGCKGANGPAPAHEIRSLLDDQVEAWNRGDIEGFMEGYLVSPDLVFAGGGKFTRGWDTLLERYRKAYPEGKMGVLRFDDLEIHLIGEDIAWAIGTYWLEMEDGAPHGAFTLVFRRTEAGWKIVHDHSSSFKEPDEKK